MDNLIRVSLYIRVSTDKQAKEGDSLEAQENALVEYAKKNNMIIVDKYIDGGESGQKLNRTNLTRLLEDVKENKIDLIIMTKLDRWFRSVADFYKVQSILDKYKVKWKTIWEDYDTTTASGEFWLNMSLSLARMEAKRTGERINSIFDHKYKIQKTVCTGFPPYGYKISKDKKLIINEKEAQYIRELFNYYLKTNSMIKTTKWFQQNCEKKSHCTILKYLKNTIYIGKFKRKKTGEIIDNYVPPILEENLFYKVQNLLKKNIKGTPSATVRPYTFSGLIKCGECGLNMTGVRGGSGKVQYYRCKRAVSGSLCNNKKYVKEIELETYLKENILKELEKQKLEIKKLNPKVNMKKIDISKLKTKLNKLVELYTNELIDIDYYKQEYYNINEEIKKANEKNQTIKEFDTSEIEKLLKSSFFEIYEKLDPLEKRRLLTTIIDNIEIKSGKISAINFIEQCTK